MLGIHGVKEQIIVRGHDCGDRDSGERGLEWQVQVKVCGMRRDGICGGRCEAGRATVAAGARV